MPVSFAHVKAKVKHNRIEEKRAAINNGAKATSLVVRVSALLWCCGRSQQHTTHTKAKPLGTCTQPTLFIFAINWTGQTVA